MRAEREVIQSALARSNNTLSVAARLLGVSRPTLYSLMQTHGIETELTKGNEVPEETVAGAASDRAGRRSADGEILASD